MDINETLRDAQFKDARPVATVEKILKILADNGIRTEETWFESNVPYCHALAIRIPGTGFCVNGKGLTPQFARASGYGELMERLQLGFTGAPGMQKDGSYSFDETKYTPIDCTDLVTQSPERYQKLADRVKDFQKVELTLAQMLSQFGNAEGRIPCIPCYNLTAGKADWFPNDIRLRVYGSNGCAAGNSEEEAIVQALSEVVERHHQNQILLKDLTPPDVPEDLLRQCATAYDIITYVRSQGFHVVIKDCSLGMKFPVVCACFIHRATGKYHTHFGAYPIFEIALERALTETFQGRSIGNIARFEDLTYNPADSASLTNLVNEFTYGTWTKSPGFFSGSASLPFNANMGFTGSGNKALLQECVEYFTNLGHEILVCNHATLGFPTCHVLVPGYSEIFIHRLNAKTNDQRYYRHSINALRCPSEASIQDKLGLLMHLEQMDKIANRVRHMHGFLNGARLSADLSEQEESALLNGTLAYIYYDLGRYADVVRCLNALIPVSHGELAGRLIALKRYLTLKLQKKDDALIEQTLALFHGPEMIENFRSGTNPLDACTLHCRLDCREDCRLHGVCHYRRVTELDELISQRVRTLDHQSFIHRLNTLLSEESQ